MTRKEAIHYSIFSCFGVVTGTFVVARINRLRLADVSNLEYYKELIAEISEMIIPATSDSPGAIDAGVPDYIVRVLNHCVPDRDRRVFFSGLTTLESYCRYKFSSSFFECHLSEKISVLEYFEKRGTFSSPILNKIRIKLLGPTFFEIIKEQTIWGYCTSKIGSMQGLGYDPVPRHFIACQPLVPGQRSWALK